MGITITTDPSTATLSLPISLIFWGFVIAYALHILEESVLGDVFVEKVKRQYWPQYTWGKFAGFNTILMSLNILAIILYEVLGGAWILFPLSLASERFFNGFYHLGETFASRKFSSGLLTSIIFWVLGYFIIRYAIIPGQIDTVTWTVSAAIGLVISLLMTGVLALGIMRGIWNKKAVKRAE